MALIDLKTDFRSLKFGLGQASDKVGGGYSNQPYIVKPIPDYDDDGSNIFNTGGPDSILRGGLMAPIKSIDDVSRLAQMFFDLKSPNGLLFTAKQNTLSRTSVKTEASVGPGTAGGTVNQGVYLPTSTLAQAGVGFTGTHLNLLGLNPFSPGLNNDSLLSQKANAGLVKYEQAAKNANLASNNVFHTDTKTLRERNPNFDLFQITNPFILGSEQQNPFQEFIETLIPEVNGKFENRLLKIWYDKQDSKNNDVNVLEYGGGPGSVLGIGKTKIKFADQRTGVNNPNSKGNWLPNQDLEELRDTTRQVFYRASNLAISASVLDVANMDFKVNRGPEKSDALTRTQNEINEALGKDPIKTTGSYLEQIIEGTKQEDTNNLSNNDLLQKSENLDGNALSPFTINNELINNVVADRNLKTFGSTQPIPNSTTPTTYTKASGVSVKYNSLISEIPNANSIDNSKIITKSPDGGIVGGGGEGFSVYQPSGSQSPWPTNTPLQSAGNSATWTQTQIISQQKNVGKLKGEPTIQDFRRELVGSPKNPKVGTSTIMSLAPNYSGPNAKNLEYRVSAGDPGKSKDVLKYSIKGEAIDKINARMPYESTVPKDSRANHGNDLCKFSIGILNNDGTGTSTYIHFRAFINEFSDKYNADWGSTQYIGRADKFHNYKGFERSISMGWTVYAQSKAELAPMYKKLNLLASSLAPSYSSGGFMQGNLARLTVGGYLYNQLGIIKSISYTIPQESTWEIGIDEEGRYDNEVKELPHMISVTGFEFIPIENTVPQYDLTRFINLKRGMSETDPKINLYAKD